MKKIILVIVACSFWFAGTAQFNSSAPWMKELNAQKKSSGDSEPLKFQEIVDAFNEYWKDKDHTKKGSGYKPFKRWENFWKDCLNDDGTLMSPKQIWDAGMQKNALQSKMVDNSNWVAIGPDDIIDRSFSSANIGRVNTIIVDPVDPNKYYAGTPAGGIWRSLDAGASWVPLSDELPQIGVSAIAIDPVDTDIIYIGTGDDDANDTVSVGVLKSTDGGQTWNTTGLTFTVSGANNISEIYLDPSDRNKVFVSSSRGFYKSTNGGTNFARIFNADLNDMKLKPGDSNVIYAVSDSQVFRSDDNGDSFSTITSGLPLSSTLSRMVIDVTPANPNYVYVMSAANDANFSFEGIYKSTDSGVNFTKTAFTNTDIFGAGQAWYDMALAVSDTDADEIYTGELDIWKSTDGGDNFTQVNRWSVRTESYTHADIHFLRFFNGDLYCGSDGGIFKSTNGGNTFSDLTQKMQIGQFYEIAVSNSNGKSKKMAGGLQDNGSFGLTTAGEWNVYGGGDGMDAAIDPNNDDNYYGFMQFGQNLWISTNGGRTQTSRVARPGDVTNNTANWVTPLRMNSESELYAGYNAVYRLDGNAFVRVSPDFTGSSDTGRHRIDQLEIDPSNSDIMYATINETMWKSTDRGVSFTEIESFTLSISSVTIHSSNSNIVYVTTSGRSGGVFRSTDGGQNFTDITGDLPAVPKLVIKHQGLHSQDPLYVGTTIGVYRTDNTTPGVWETFDNNLPNSPVRDLEINVNDGNITAATYGRGVWQSPIPVELAQDDIRLVAINSPGTEINCGAVSPSFTVKNNGTNPISSIDIEYVVDGNSNTTTWTGTINSNATAVIDLPELNLDLGEHSISVVASVANDANGGNNSIDVNFNTNSTFNVSEGVNDFEDASDALLTGGGVLWERGVPAGALLNTAASGQNAYATNLDGNYPDGITSYLISKCYDMTTVGENPVLKFNMAFDIELDWDFINVEYSTDGGAAWNILGSANDPNWYNSDTAVNLSNCATCPGAQWTGTDATMKEYSYDLSAFSGESNFVFRFNFVSDGAFNNEGVVIDDVVIEGNTLSVEEVENRPALSLFPNPSSGIFNIQWRNAANVSYTVSDLTGKVIASQKGLISSENAAQINLSNYARGMYFLNVNLDGVEETKKLIKN
ncbi:T9SS type A sorting domain-containing protein [uncultured Aquimarina sp.]|uniref:T9SS type A sorting domain-containing protein n=1 Tax=uncultured Aquimarina sp. TaxID=575652 RepID=UPI00261163F8|nr:T9SS type A sorting domain-containing protein [uncultured Aquimarina sp.]